MLDMRETREQFESDGYLTDKNEFIIEPLISFRKN